MQVSQEAGQVVWYSHLFHNFPQFVLMHTVKGFGIVHKAEVDFFSETLLLFDDPMDIGNFISGSSAFSKSTLNIWKFTIHVLGFLCGSAGKESTHNVGDLGLIPGLGRSHGERKGYALWPAEAKSQTQLSDVHYPCLKSFKSATNNLKCLKPSWKIYGWVYFFTGENERGVTITK